MALSSSDWCWWQLFSTAGPISKPAHGLLFESMILGVPWKPVIGFCSFLGTALEMEGACSPSGCEFVGFLEGNVNRNWTNIKEVS